MHGRDDGLNVPVAEDGQIQPIASMGVKPEVIGHQPEQQPRLPAFPEHLDIGHVIVFHAVVVAHQHSRRQGGFRLGRTADPMNEITSPDVGVEVQILVIQKPYNRRLKRGQIHVSRPDIFCKRPLAIVTTLLLSTRGIETRKQEQDLGFQHLEYGRVQHCRDPRPLE